MIRLVIFGAVALGLIGIVASTVAGGREPAAVLDLHEPQDPPAASPNSAPQTILVDVVGAVARPGVVRLPEGARVLDALLAAGGMTAEADLLALNKAALLQDGARVYVPRPGESVPASAAGGVGDPKIELNSATASELDELPGVGPATSARIIRSREQQRFNRIEELQTRGLVSARVFGDVKDLVTVR